MQRQDVGNPDPQSTTHPPPPSRGSHASPAKNHKAFVLPYMGPHARARIGGGILEKQRPGGAGPRAPGGSRPAPRGWAVGRCGLGGSVCQVAAPGAGCSWPARGGGSDGKGRGGQGAGPGAGMMNGFGFQPIPAFNNRRIVRKCLITLAWPRLQNTHYRKSSPEYDYATYPHNARKGPGLPQDRRNTFRAIATLPMVLPRLLGPFPGAFMCLWPIRNGTDSRQQTGTATKHEQRSNKANVPGESMYLGSREMVGGWAGEDGRLRAGEGKDGGSRLVDLSDQKSKKKEEKRL